jgi:uncharacterized protein YcnI
MKKIFISALSIFGIFFISVLSVSAHVVVKPSEAGIGTFQTFTISVPSEKNISTYRLRLVVPEGLTFVTPNVKPGWFITEKKNGDVVTEIQWTGSRIPPGQRDEFVFSAKVPAEPTTLQWKAYQTYTDGSVISWDVDPSTNPTDFTKSGPYSTTTIINDLNQKKPTSQNTFTFPLSIAAFALSVIALGTARKKK